MEASNPPVDGDILTLTPSEAGEILQQRALDFQQPAPLAPSNAREADARLAQLINNPEWARKLMSGDVATRDEFQKLSEMKAVDDTLTDPVPQVIETTIGAEGLRRRDVISAAADLRRLWKDSENCEAAIASVLDPNATVDLKLPA